MKKLHAGLGALLGGLLVLTLGAHGADQAREHPTVVVGTFDSRAVAVAYIRSDGYSSYLRSQKEDVERILERAREAGDRAFVADLERLGPAMQQRTHHQGFGAAPVDDLLARIEDRFADIARELGVDVIVSKWVLAYRDPSAAFVDVTDRLVAEFDPSTETLSVIRQLVATEPVPLDQLEEDH